MHDRTIRFIIITHNPKMIDTQTTPHLYTAQYIHQPHSMEKQSDA